MTKKVSLAKVSSSSCQPSEPPYVGLLKCFMGNLNPLIEIKIVGGVKKAVSGMVRQSRLGICKKLSCFDERNFNTLSS